MAGSVPRGQRRIGRLKLPKNVIAEVDRVREIPEAVRVLGEPGHGQCAGDRSQREHQALVADLDRAVDRVDCHSPALGVERGHATDDQLRVRAHHPKRDDDVPRLEHARGGLGQQRGEEHEVLGADDRRRVPAEQPRDHRAGVTAARDQRAAVRPAGQWVAAHREPSIRSRSNAAPALSSMSFRFPHFGD